MNLLQKILVIYLYIFHMYIFGNFSALVVAKHTVFTEECAVIGLFLDAEPSKVAAYTVFKTMGHFIVKAEDSS